MFSYFYLMSHCFDFKGRASRTEYWFSIFGFVFCGSILTIIEALILAFVFHLTPGMASLTPVTRFFHSIAMLSLSMRRLRDNGFEKRKYFWWLLPVCIPLAGFASLFPDNF